MNKPKGKSSADVIRIVQRVFRKSPYFSEPLELEQIARNKESGNQKRKRKGKSGPPDVKMGHGGTLDPMASMNIQNSLKYQLYMLTFHAGSWCFGIGG